MAKCRVVHYGWHVVDNRKMGEDGSMLMGEVGEEFSYLTSAALGGGTLRRQRVLKLLIADAPSLDLSFQFKRCFAVQAPTS